MTNLNLVNAKKLQNTGAVIIRYGLALILLMIGMVKFTSYEAEGISGLVANSPLLSWGYQLTSKQGFSNILGVTEIIFAILIASRKISAKASAIGSIGTVVMTLTTISFLLSTPGAWQPGYGFPFLSPMPGQFLIKDVLLLGAALWTGGEALMPLGIEQKN